MSVRQLWMMNCLCRQLLIVQLTYASSKLFSTSRYLLSVAVKRKVIKKKKKNYTMTVHRSIIRKKYLSNEVSVYDDERRRWRR
ncbi:hypothetical protein BY996DRAFT_7683255 [Phakopsora pachyrhizi]|nr:hypothetical protein BY996DRAFT_7683255 [Phakopsora pachyrhizi]